MNENGKDIRFDDELQMEAYRFAGLAQPFPNHFHEYYVIGLIEVGQRLVTVNHREYRIGPGDMLTFNPLDNHACVQADSGGMSYRALNIKPDVMGAIVREVLGGEGPVRFREPILLQHELAPIFLELHTRVMGGAVGLEKEELCLLFLRQLLQAHAERTGGGEPAPRREVEEVCAYLEAHYAERITLDMLGAIAGLNKYTLLRTFTRWKGITPYRYLETIRIGKARQLLEQGVEPAAVAQQTGFSDQSHFTGFFGKLTGLTPGQYQQIFREETP